MSNDQKGSSTGNNVAKKFRCLVCDRLISEIKSDRCPICGADNTQWLEFKKKKGFELLDQFPRWVWIAVGMVFVAILPLPFVACFAGLSPGSFLPPFIAAILALGLSISVIVAVVYVFKFPLRNRELLRQVKRKKRGPGLVMLAALSAGVSVLCSLGVVLLLWVALTFTPDGEWAIRTRDLETGCCQSLIEEQGRLSHPVWSPDGETIVFASNRDGDWDIYAMNVDGTDLTNLTNNNAADRAPSWSYDGSKITFVSDRQGQWDIFIMDPDGRNPQLLPGESRRVIDPAWSPDGKKIAFVVASPNTFSVLLSDQVGLTRNLSLIIAMLYVGFVPFLILALMLVGVKSFTKRLDKEFPRPIYLDTDNLAKVALKSTRAHLHVPIEENGPGTECSPLPIPLDADRLAETTREVAKSVRKLLKIPDERKQELLVLSVAGRRERGLNFLFERRDEQRWYRVESELDGQILALEGSPRVEELQIISMSRTASGGLNMVVSRQTESEKEDEKGVIKFISEEKRYEVETDEWGRILSLKEESCTPRPS